MDWINIILIERYAKNADLQPCITINCDTIPKIQAER